MNDTQKKLHNRIEEISATLTSPKISFEFFPPKSEAANVKLQQTIQRLTKLNPEFVSVTYGADGSTRETTYDLVTSIKQEGLIEPIPHLTCVGASQVQINDIAEQYWALGVRKILALRGDPEGGAGKEYVPFDGGYAYSEDLIKGLKKLHDFEILVGAYPEVHPQAPSAAFDLENLKRKFDAGASTAITQFFFETDNYLRFRDAGQKIGIEQSLVPGILPVLNFTNLKKFALACGAYLPGWLHEAFDGLGDDPETSKLIAINVAIEQIKRLQSEGVDHFQIYTLNQVELTHAICSALGIHDNQQKIVV